jgi:hypothetical protein
MYFHMVLVDLNLRSTLRNVFCWMQLYMHLTTKKIQIY